VCYLARLYIRSQLRGDVVIWGGLLVGLWSTDRLFGVFIVTSIAVYVTLLHHYRISLDNQEIKRHQCHTATMPEITVYVDRIFGSTLFIPRQLYSKNC